MHRSGEKRSQQKWRATITRPLVLYWYNSRRACWPWIPKRVNTSGRGLTSRTTACFSGTSFGVGGTAAGRTVIDLESGQDRWKLSSLGFSSVKDIVFLASRD